MHFRKEIFLIKSCLNLDFNATRNERSWHRNKISMLELVLGDIRSSLLTCLSAVVDVAPIKNVNKHEATVVTPIMLLHR